MADRGTVSCIVGSGSGRNLRSRNVEIIRAHVSGFCRLSPEKSRQVLLVLNAFSGRQIGAAMAFLICLWRAT